MRSCASCRPCWRPGPASVPSVVNRHPDPQPRRPNEALLEAFLAALADRVSPATVAKHYRSLQQLWRWLVEDGEIPRSPMERMRPPQVPEQPVDILIDDELRALLDTTRGNTFEKRRDA